MYRHYFLILLSAFSINVAAFGWDEKEIVGTYSPLQIYKNNLLRVSQMRMGVAIIGGVYFSKVLTPEHVIRHERSWGRLKLHAQKQLQNFILKKK